MYCKTYRKLARSLRGGAAGKQVLFELPGLLAVWPCHQYQQFSGSGSLQSSPSSSVVAPRQPDQKGSDREQKNMRNLCVSLEDNEVTCPCCLQKPPSSRSMRAVHLRVARFPIPPLPVLVVVAASVSPASLRVAVGPVRTRERLTERGASTRRGRHALHAGRGAGCSLSSVNLFRAS